MTKTRELPCEPITMICIDCCMMADDSGREYHMVEFYDADGFDVPLDERWRATACVGVTRKYKRQAWVDLRQFSQRRCLEGLLN